MPPTLFEFAGGEPAFLALAAAHHARCLADPELNHPFSHPGQHPQLFVRWFGAEAYGPQLYWRDDVPRTELQPVHPGDELPGGSTSAISLHAAAAGAKPACHWLADVEACRTP